MPLGPSHVFSALYGFFLMFDDRSEHSGTHSGVALGVYPQRGAGIDRFGRFSRGGNAPRGYDNGTIAVRDTCVRVQQCAPVGACQGTTGTSQGSLRD